MPRYRLDIVPDAPPHRARHRETFEAVNEAAAERTVLRLLDEHSAGPNEYGDLYVDDGEGRAHYVATIDPPTASAIAA